MKHIHLLEIESTQTYLHQLLQNNVEMSEENIIISTNNQTGGRGRGANLWESGEGSLAFSFLCTPPKIITLAALEVAILMSHFLEKKTSQSINLKWPNDLFFNSNKVGGILIQVVSHKLIVGIGLNLFNCNSNQYKGISHHFEEGDYQNIPREFYEYFLNNRIKEDNIRQEWNSLCVHLDKKVKLTEDKEYVGIFKGIGKNGQAIISVENNDIEFYNGSLTIL